MFATTTKNRQNMGGGGGIQLKPIRKGEWIAGVGMKESKENTFNFIAFNTVAQQASLAMCGWAEHQFIKVNTFFRIVIILKIFCIF